MHLRVQQRTYVRQRSWIEMKTKLNSVDGSTPTLGTAFNPLLSICPKRETLWNHPLLASPYSIIPNKQNPPSHWGNISFRPKITIRHDFSRPNKYARIAPHNALCILSPIAAFELHGKCNVSWSSDHQTATRELEPSEHLNMWLMTKPLNCHIMLVGNE